LLRGFAAAEFFLSHACRRVSRRRGDEKEKASFKEGILEIRLPKTEEGKKKEITVKVE
jgi:HSP20 family molecular chaperone IbpA